MQSASMETKPVALPVLPDDVLAAILGRLLARRIAASRCVCRAWRDLVDDRELLLRLRRLLPHSVTGLFVSYFHLGTPHFFARPAPAPPGRPGHRRIDGRLGFVVPEQPCGWYTDADHCNGLVLYRDDEHGELYVCNPTTQGWVCLPRLSFVGGSGLWMRRAFFVFSPAVSPHYEVLVEPPPDLDKELEPSTWPPSRWTWHVFSSTTGKWQERSFLREGDGVGMELLNNCTDCTRLRYAVYWQGALYVHCSIGEYISRLSLSDGKYQIIEPPIDSNHAQSFIGKSEKGLYLASIYEHHLQVWILNNECSDQTECWMLKHDAVLGTDHWLAEVASGDDLQKQFQGPWIMDDYYGDAKGEMDFDWSSDDDDIMCTQDLGWNEGMYSPAGMPLCFLGFHPYKEVIFLTAGNVAVAYHLNTSKVQFLGLLNLEGNNDPFDLSFVYTPFYALHA